MAALRKRELETLRERCAGRVVTPRDGDYDAMRSVWNGAIDRRPAVIVRCGGPGDVSAAIRFAREEGLEISVRGGGHGFSGSAVTSGGVMLDLSPLHGVTVHPRARRAICGGGGNFGVVTSFVFRLHPVGPAMHVTLLFWEAERGPEALQAADDAVSRMPEHVGVLIGYGMCAPPRPAGTLSRGGGNP